jgi:hypothetical protein
MSSPHLRRRYRATGSRSGLTYLFIILGAAALYVGQRHYISRQQRAFDQLRSEFESHEQKLVQLTAQRDSLIGLAVIQPRAEALGLHSMQLKQMGRLPLKMSPRLFEPAPANSVQLAEAVGRVWRWLDPPELESNAVQAAE